uniref:Uncharacterized protein n=1 Tax=Rhizophora mucronata TaxID=61149 RepID=A0A2P2QFU1_RHIMU
MWVIVELKLHHRRTAQVLGI